jgi:carbonic anhydrase
MAFHHHHEHDHDQIADHYHHSENLENLLKNNRDFAAEFKHHNPVLLEKLGSDQKPSILWLGCADSRVPPETLLKLGPGRLFVHRNIANVFRLNDPSTTAVLRYAVGHLGVRHVIVSGHYGCGGSYAALSRKSFDQLDGWLNNIRDVYDAHKDELHKIQDQHQRADRLSEFGAIASARAVATSNVVQQAWHKGKSLTVWTWVYDIRTGLVKDLNNTYKGPGDIPETHRLDVSNLH